jgi:hypothetical protein
MKSPGSPTSWQSYVARAPINLADTYRYRYITALQVILEAPTKFGICYQTPPFPLLRNEDIQLCLILRNSLERRGLRFAPPGAALHFSVEYMHPTVHERLDLTELFGHHAQTRRLRPNSVVEVGMNSRQIRDAFGESQILELLRRYGYTVVCQS